MNLLDFVNFSKKLTEEASALYAEKNRSYASDEDALGNFSSIATALGLRPEEVACIFLNKHIQSIYSYFRTGAVTEGMRGRFIDAINYLCVLAAMTEGADGS